MDNKQRDLLKELEEHQKQKAEEGMFKVHKDNEVCPDCGVCPTCGKKLWPTPYYPPWHYDPYLKGCWEPWKISNY